MRRSRIHRPTLAETREITASRYADPERWPDRPGYLPPLAGASNIVTQKFFLYPQENIVEENWALVAGSTFVHHWENVAQTGVTETSGVPETDTTASKRGLTNTASSTAKEVFGLERLQPIGANVPGKLPVGSTVVGTKAAALHYYSRAKKEKDFSINLRSGIFEVLSENTALANAWKSVKIEGAKLTELGAKLKENLTFEFVLKKLKAEESFVFVAYLEVEVEYEPASHYHMVGQAVQRAAVI